MSISVAAPLMIRKRLDGWKGGPPGESRMFDGVDEVSWGRAERLRKEVDETGAEMWDE